MAFSRLQLAAALVEYDNDNPTSSSPKLASQSAIFAHTRRNRASPPPVAQHEASRQIDGRTAAMDTGYGGDGNASIMASRYGDGRETIANDDTIQQLDLTSWGLPPPSPSSPVSHKQPSSPLALRKPIAERFTTSYTADAPHRKSISGLVADTTPPQSRRASRTVSFHDYDRVASGENAAQRPHTMYTTGDVAKESVLNRGRPKSPFEIDRATLDRAVIADRRSRVVSFEGGDLSMPGSELLRSGMGDQEVLEEPRSMEGTRPDRRNSNTGGVLNRGRPKSPFEQDIAGQRNRIRTTSLDNPLSRRIAGPAPLQRPSSTMYLASHTALPPSPGANTLSFPSQSPSYAKEHLASSPHPTETEINPFAIPPPAGSRLSRFDPKAALEARQMSQDSSAMATGTRTRMNSRMSSNWDQPGPMEQEQMRPHDTHAYLTPQISRPQTLIMPSPLQGVMNPLNSTPRLNSAEHRGFILGHKPLPPGALTRPDSFIGSLPSSGSLNGLANMSLSQKLFTSSLEVGGIRGEGFVGGAQRDGEEGLHTIGGYDLPDDDDVEDDYGTAAALERPGQEEDWRPTTRNATGPSLMDRIEARKQAMKGKQRVFEGDARPAMMARQTEANNKTDNRISWVPVELPAISSSQNKRMSKPLLAFGPSDHLATSPPARPHMDKTKSVFGVDTVWNRELDKLKRVEEAERGAAEREAQELALNPPKEKKAKKGKRRATKALNEVVMQPGAIEPEAAEQQRLESPPTIIPGQDISHTRQQHPPVDRNDWYASSSEDEDGNKRPKQRALPRAVSATAPCPRPVSDESSSDEDVPLSKAFNLGQRASARAVSTPVVKVKSSEESSEEDEPLSRLKAKASTNHLAPTTPQANASEDDDIPLALRQAHIQAQSRSQATNDDEDEDDVPLGARHAQAGMAQQQRMSVMHHQQQQQEDFYRQSMFAPQQPTYPFGGLMPGMMSPMSMPMMGMNGLDPMMTQYQHQFGIGTHPQMPFPPPGFMPNMSFPLGMGMPMKAPHLPQQQPPPMDPTIDRWRREIDGRAKGSGTGTGSAGTSVVGGSG